MKRNPSIHKALTTRRKLWYNKMITCWNLLIISRDLMRNHFVAWGGHEPPMNRSDHFSPQSGTRWELASISWVRTGGVRGSCPYCPGEQRGLWPQFAGKVNLITRGSVMQYGRCNSPRNFPTMWIFPQYACCLIVILNL